MKRLFRRPRTFEGGLYLPACSERTAGRPIEAFEPPALLRVPMQQHDGPASTILVAVGQQVEAGERIGRADEHGAVNVHAPLAGRVVALDRVDTAWRSDIPAVHIRPGSGNTHGRVAAFSFQSSKSPEPDHDEARQLAQLADEAGLINCREPALGFGQQLCEAASRGITDVIINAMACEPMLTAEAQMLEESAEAILAAGGRVRDALRARRVWLAMDAAERQVVRRIRAMVAGTPVRVIGLYNKYPQATPVLLTWSVAGREVPYGRSPEHVGVFVVEVPSLVGLEAAATRHEPMTHGVVTVTGPAARRPGHYRIPIGTSFLDVIRHVGLASTVVRVVDGGPMTGRAVESLDVVVTKQTRAILLLDRHSDRVASPGPCVRCGWCQEDCPVGLDPQALLDLYELDCYSAGASWYPHACVECGLCSYVCPAELPLADAVRRLKRRVPIVGEGGRSNGVSKTGS